MGKKWHGKTAGCSGRPPMHSPGRPPGWRREHKQLLMEAIGYGLSSEYAAVVASVSPAVGVRWFREGGEMSSGRAPVLSGRYLSLGEREEIAILHAQDCGVREIARRVWIALRLYWTAFGVILPQERNLSDDQGEQECRERAVLVKAQDGSGVAASSGRRPGSAVAGVWGGGSAVEPLAGGLPVGRATGLTATSCRPSGGVDQRPAGQDRRVDHGQ